jgi:hypothetical protein
MPLPEFFDNPGKKGVLKVFAADLTTDESVDRKL